MKNYQIQMGLIIKQNKNQIIKRKNLYNRQKKLTRYLTQKRKSRLVWIKKIRMVKIWSSNNNKTQVKI